MSFADKKEHKVVYKLLLKIHLRYANKLNLDEESAGVVQIAKKNGIEISVRILRFLKYILFQGRWYEKLGEWEEALNVSEILIVVIEF